MPLSFNPKDYAHLLTQMIKETKAHNFFPDPSKVYFVLQGPKVWMDTFIHFNKRRPVVYLQYGPNPEKPSVPCFLSNVSDVEFKSFVLNFHKYKQSPLILSKHQQNNQKKAGDKIMSFEFKAPDTRIDQYSNETCHFEGADTDVAKYVTSSMESR